MKKRILTFSLDKRDTTAFWRSLPMAYIQHPDFEIVDISDTKVFDWTIFASSDIFFMQRPFHPQHLTILSAAKGMGLKIILDYDDLLLDAVDMYNPTHLLYKENQANIQSCLLLADEIWASTQAIKDCYLPINQNIHVIPNAHNDRLFKVGLKRTFTYNKKCYFRGGASHQADVNEVANQLISVINENCKFDDSGRNLGWEFTFMGDRFTYLEMNTGDNYQIINGMSIMEFFRYLNNENPSVMIFPLCNTKFNKGKSNISWIEATYAGSAFFGNKSLPEFNFDFVSNIADLNSESLSDVDTLQANNERSWEYICDNLLLSKINQLRIDRILANL